MDLRALLAVTLTASLLAAGCVAPDDDAGDAPMDETLAWRAPVTASAGCVDPTGVAFAHPQPLVTLETNMGDILVEVFLDRVPVTAQNFLDLVEDGFYDGIEFHRIIRGFMMQGGNPATADPPRDPAAPIPDEFHHLLRHDAAGVLSMANAGPNTGSSQFFITFGPTPHLDDKHAVFGRVLGGMDVVRAVEEEAATSDGTPAAEVVLQRATVAYPEGEASTAVAIGVWTPKQNLRVAAGGGSTGVLVVAVSCADRLVPVSLTAETPDGVVAVVEPGFDVFDLPAAQRVAVGVTLEAKEGPAGTFPVTLVLSGGGTEVRLEFEVERSPDAGRLSGERGDTIEAHYLGVLVDGRMFDTSFAEVADDPQTPRAPSFSERARGDPFAFTPGQGVIEGFTILALGLDEGTTAVGRIPPEQAYGTSGQHALGGKTLIFLLEAMAVNRPG